MHTHVRMHAHMHTTILQFSWILSGTIWVSRLQKGKTNLDLLKQEIVSGNKQRLLMYSAVAFGALMLLVGQQEVHPACKN